MLSLIILFFITMIDFALTYYGVSIGIITEANPLLVWLFNLPLFWSTVMRIVIVMATPFLPLYYLYRKKSIAYKWALRGAYILNAFIICLHVQWIYFLIKYPIA